MAVIQDALEKRRVPASTAGDPIAVRDLATLFQRQFGIDVKRFFPSDTFALQRVEPHGYHMFNPVKPGDDRFYADLMDRLGYEVADKAEFVAARRFVDAGQSVLDVGSGPGRFSLHCTGAYKGIDFNQSAVAEAAREGRNVACEALEDQPISAFDVVTLFQVIEHVPDPESFLASAARCVKPGGRLIISTPDEHGPVGYSVNHTLNYPPHHLSWWSAESLTSALMANGFEVDHVWREPLQQAHLPSFVFSLLHPRRDRHFDLSLRARVTEFFAKVIARTIGRLYRPVPYVHGHTVMVAGRRIQS